MPPGNRLTPYTQHSCILFLALSELLCFQKSSFIAIQKLIDTSRATRFLLVAHQLNDKEILFCHFFAIRKFYLFFIYLYRTVTKIKYYYLHFYNHLSFFSPSVCNVSGTQSTVCYCRPLPSTESWWHWRPDNCAQCLRYPRNSGN